MQDSDFATGPAHTDTVDRDGSHTFDYIVVGAGASGSVIAANLAKQTPSVKILLLDAGPDHRPANMSDNMASQNPMALWGDKQWTWPQVKVARTAAQDACHRGSGGPVHRSAGVLRYAACCASNGSMWST